MKHFLFFFLTLFCSFYLLAEDTYSKSMIIVTTNSIVENSDKLDDYILAKKKRGFDIKVATEDNFGGKDVTGHEKAVLIREWLKENHEGFSYLLI